MSKPQYRSILGGIGAEDFLRDYWQKKPLLIRQALPGFESPLDANELAGLACEASVESRLIQHGDEGWSLQQGPFNARTLERLPERDWTLLVQDIEKHLPELAEYLDLFNFIPSWRIDDLMISVAGPGGGVGPHTDAYDVFLLQANGRRRWSVAERYDPALIEGLALRVLRNFHAEQEWVLEPGDMLYLPPDVAHDGVALDEHCMTWSIGFRAPSLKDMFSDFAEWLFQRLPGDRMYADPDLELQEAAGGGLSPEALARMRKLMLSALQPSDRALDYWFGQFITEPKPWLKCEPVAEPLTAEALKRLIDAGEDLQRDSRARLTWSLFDDRAVLFVDGEAWDFPSSAAGLLEAVCEHRKLSPMLLRNHLDAPGIDLLQRLHQHGAIRFEFELHEESEHGE